MGLGVLPITFSFACKVKAEETKDIAGRGSFSSAALGRGLFGSGSSEIAQQQQEAIDASQGEAAAVTIRNRPGERVGRNDPCPCGSGKKYKKCCMTKGGDVLV